MTTVLCLTVHDRAVLLDQALEALFIKYPCGADHVVVVVDGPKDPDVLTILKKYSSHINVVETYKLGAGVAQATNASLAIGVCVDSVSLSAAEEHFREHSEFRAERPANIVLVHCDSDTYIERAGWCKDLSQFLLAHPEVGLVAPDLPGRYMRIKRKDYDEIEYALGMVWAVRGDVFESTTAYHGIGFFDTQIHHQFDPDVCYRIRLQGKRIALLDVGKLVDLGVGSGDSSRSEILHRGGFEFLRKWNQYFVGHFSYKSPMMLRWDEFPLNYLWRRMWLAQFQYNQENEVKEIQGHRFEMIQFPVTPNKWLLTETREALHVDLVFDHDSSYEKTDSDLLAGHRSWKVTDVKGSAR